MDNTKFKKCCPNCSQFYQLKFQMQPKGNIPLFLSCGHSMCDSCISNIVKFLEPIECKICECDMTLNPETVAQLAQNKVKLYDLFPVNLALLGELTLELIQQSSEPKKKKEDDYFIDLKAIIQNADCTQGQCLECHNPSTKMCQQCATVLCETCFNKSHKNFIIFKNHVLKNIEQVIQPNNCKVHKGKALEYYCNDCKKSTCMDCLMVGGQTSCKNHNVVSLQEVNEGFLEDINSITPKVDEVFKRLTKTAVDVGHLLHNIENDTGSSSELTKMLATVEQHFSKLTCEIQKHKQEVISIITKLKCSEQESLRKTKDFLADNIKKAKTVLNTINLTSDPKKAKQINLAVLLEEATQIAETPWCLSKDVINDPLKISVNEDLCPLMSDYIHMEGNANSVYKLRSTAELGEDIPPPPPAPVYPPELVKDVRQLNPKPEPKNVKNPSQGFYRNVPTYRSKSGSVSSLNSLDSDSSFTNNLTVYGDQRPVVQQVQPFSESQHPKQLHEGSQELIYITHIVDPHHLFVQRACHQSLVKEMMREFRNAVSLPKPSVNHVAEGKIYLVFNKADNMWQRCRVISINRKNQSNPTFYVFCIDFGSTEVVSIDKLRLLPPARLQSPYPLAIHCSLANCEPKTTAWTSDDAYLVQNIIDNKQAIIHVRHIRSTSNYTVTLECDVITFEDSISLAHALVFHERARMPDTKLKYPKITGVMDRPKLFINNNDLKLKSVEEVYITHIVSPDNFFVRKRHLQSVYEKLCEDLDQEYSLSNSAGTVYLPEVGMVCVVNVDKCRGVEASGTEGGGSWARAVVTELPGRLRARLLLPDTGDVLVAHWTALRHIHHRFTTLRALATECYLAGVTPLNKKWSPSSVALLHRFEDRLLEMHVEDTRRGSVGVTLYDRATDDVVCVNTEMIKHKFAVTFGLYMFNKPIVVEDRVITNKCPLQQKTELPKPARQVTVLKRPSVAKPIDENELDAKDKGPLRLEAKLLHYQSPSLIYVSLVHQAKAFNELYEKIQKHYSKKKSVEKEEWAVGDRCCTICQQSQTWRRAAIVELQEKNAKVFYSDFACVETVPVTELRELIPEFAAMGDAAIKCHLCGIMPADGSEEWPTITKEYLKELLDAYQRVFITKLGNFKNKSMPVEVWVYHTIQGGALEPNVSEWRCLNKKIIDQGLGIPDKSQKTSEGESSTCDDMLSFLKNVSGSVDEWLQLEPLPIKPLPTESATQSTSASSSTVLDDFDDAHDSSTVFISDWLPAEPLKSNEFTGMPTYVDHDGIIYLHDVTQRDTLDLIRKALDVRFKSADPKAKYAKWTVGEPCIALYYLDNRFYRGRVMEVNNDNSTCFIHYVDYGNEEPCSFENLRKSIALYQIPIQAHKCVLARIRPVGSHWERQALDYVHKSTVEKQCFVKIVGEPVNGIIPIELKYDKLWINDHLVDFEMAIYSDGSKAVVRKFGPDKSSKRLAEKEKPIAIESDSGPDYIVEDEMDTSVEYFDIKCMEGKDWNEVVQEEQNSIKGKFITYPLHTDKEFMCNITIINNMSVLQLNVIHNDETNLLYEEMFATVKRKGENMPPLDGIFENKACLALFHEDNLWYRASILQCSDSRIKVRFVDYGNIEVVSLIDVREITEELTELPPATVAAQLHGVKVDPSVDVETLYQEYTQTFLDKGPFHVKVIAVEDSTLLVELRDEEGELVYENLISSGLLSKVV